MEHNESRRRWLGLAAGAVTAAPIIFMTREAFAEANANMRKALQYQDAPKNNQQCSTCVQFVPGKDPKGKGGCKAIPGDTEISPTGWCAAFVANPAAKK
jgi:hypothetical protein